MKKVFLILICFFHINLYAEENKTVYFAGGCFWCMEESFDKVEGVISVISGYSGGHLKNPTYADVVYTDSGHVEAVEITYDPKVLSYEKLLEIDEKLTQERIKKLIFSFPNEIRLAKLKENKKGIKVLNLEDENT